MTKDISVTAPFAFVIDYLLRIETISKKSCHLRDRIFCILELIARKLNPLQESSTSHCLVEVRRIELLSER